MKHAGSRLNCWEIKKCGRQPGGAHEHDLGVCPAANEVRLNGIHGGTNAGRACWVVAGTLCKGEVQGTFAHKYKNCIKCEFYNQVMREEHPRFTLSTTLLAVLNGK